MTAPAAPTAPRILFGGTFDPVHRAHISCARAVSRALGGAVVDLMPNAVPPHRPQPGASPEQRLDMLALAVAGHASLRVDPRELQRDGPSWTIDTLEALQREEPRRPRILVMGADSFAGFDNWHRWQDYARLCHLVVLPRPGADTPSARVQALFRETGADNLLASAAGNRLMLTAPVLDVSATAVREALARKGSCPAVSDPVLAYIRRHGLYNIGSGIQPGR
ncbi:MAG: nicotinate-nucleotide adenylyltransferase [Alcanivoracaceae bacterium]|nr:nicotinate-nucleotide adenylyltransferase [Alcanivoracaceae bacterium]